MEAPSFDDVRAEADAAAAKFEDKREQYGDIDGARDALPISQETGRDMAGWDERGPHHEDARERMTELPLASTFQDGTEDAGVIAAREAGIPGFESPDPTFPGPHGAGGAPGFPETKPTSPAPDSTSQGCCGCSVM